MGADETFARFDEIKQCLFALRGHRRLLVGAFAAKIAGGVEKDGIKLVQVIFAELGAVFGELEVPAVLRAKLQQHFFRVAGLAVLPGDDAVLKAAGFGEEEDLALGRRGGKRHGADSGGEKQGSGEFFQHGG